MIERNGNEKNKPDLSAPSFAEYRRVRLPAIQAAMRRLYEQPLIGLCLLLPAILWLPPIPIDETRYLAVAWEMRQTLAFLVPHLNGQWYADKPPLLFWLINFGWCVTGVHAATARLVTLACSALSIVLLGTICRQLQLSKSGVQAAQWMLVGTVYFALFANAIMFDVLLTSCVLAGLLGLLWIEACDYRSGACLLGCAIGLGILAKGPVMLLDVGFAVLLAPWWSASVRGQWRGFVGAIGCSLMLGVAIALAWAVPAALHGGADYARALFFHQTFDRVSSSFAHSRPIWWYAAILPIMLLPWTISLRGCGDVRYFAWHDKACRFALAWSMPALLVFCLINGKQPHYLLPLLPALAIIGSSLMAQGMATIRSGVFAALLLLFGATLAALPWVAGKRTALVAYHEVSPIYGLLICTLAIVILCMQWRANRVGIVAVASLLTLDLAQCALVGSIERQSDLAPIAAIIREAQAHNLPIAHIGWHHGLYEFVGRLQMPLPVIQPEQIEDWCLQNPDGLLVAMDGDLQLDAAPMFSKPFRDARASVWHSRDALHAHLIDIRTPTGESNLK